MTPAQRAAFRLYAATPPERIHTHLRAGAFDARKPQAREGALAGALVGQALRGAAVIDYEQAYLRRLCDFEQALAWGDDWERAYQEERREHLREVKRLRDRIFKLEHALKAKEFEEALRST